MQSLRRFDICNATYFITAVTFERRPDLLAHANQFWSSWSSVRPFAWVIMPDHFHALLTVKDISISTVIHRFKTDFVRAWHREGGTGRFWQNRFWDHVIRDRDDMQHHLDYIHYNPVKHGMVIDPFAYQHSSLHHWHERGYYQRDWEKSDPIDQGEEFGE